MRKSNLSRLKTIDELVAQKDWFGLFELLYSLEIELWLFETKVNDFYEDKEIHELQSRIIENLDLDHLVFVVKDLFEKTDAGRQRLCGLQEKIRKELSRKWKAAIKSDKESFFESIENHIYI